MQKELVALSIGCLLLIITFSGCLEDKVSGITAEEIKEKFLQAANSVTSYKYSSSGTIMTTRTNETGTSTQGSPYTLNCEVDISNKQLKVEAEMSYNLSDEASEGLSLVYYFADDTLYVPWGNMTWSARSYSNNWYAFSYLDRQVYFILEEAGLERLDDDVIGSVECYLLNVNPVIENLELNQSYMDLLFPQRYYNASIYQEFEETYNVDIKYWIAKDTDLLKKAYIKIIYDVTMSYNITGPTTVHTASSYETEILFYDYNVPAILEHPWQSYIDEAEVALNHLEYSNTQYGFGLNLPEGWSIDDESIWGGILFYVEGISDMNLSFFVGVPSQYNSNNLSAEVEEYLEEIITYYASDENSSLVSHGERTVNGMNAYEFISTHNSGDLLIKSKKIFVENDDRIFTLSFGGQEDLYDIYESDFEQSINSSLIIISPYYQINYL